MSFDMCSISQFSPQTVAYETEELTQLHNADVQRGQGSCFCCVYVEILYDLEINE